MYGEGQISEEVFTALRALADRGQLRPADLAVHRARARRRPAGRGDVEVANALRGIRSRLAQLAQTRAASEKVLANLEARLSGLEDRVVDKEQAARDAIAAEHDEQAARSRLAEKAEFASSRDRLTVQAQALCTDLARLDDLRAQLEAKAAELEAMQARIRLSEEVLK
jgi:chromosome segregation ATPase